MSSGIYISMAGASARTVQLDSIADNLANAQTPGYKGERAMFSTVLAEANAATGYVIPTGHGTDLRQGPVIATGNALDVLPENNAFLAVQGKNGETGYTRDGRLSIDGEGMLKTAGLPVLSINGDPIHVPHDAQVSLGGNGSVIVNGQEIDRLAMFQLQGNADRLGPSVVVPSGGGTVTAVESKLQIGSIEAGNHTAIDSAVDMISAQRSFDASMQAVQTYKHLGDSSNELGRVR
jgi:flagellar basal-body rod protein FlgF